MPVKIQKQSNHLTERNGWLTTRDEVSATESHIKTPSKPHLPRAHEAVVVRRKPKMSNPSTSVSEEQKIVGQKIYALKVMAEKGIEPAKERIGCTNRLN